MVSKSLNWPLWTACAAAEDENFFFCKQIKGLSAQPQSGEMKITCATMFYKISLIKEKKLISLLFLFSYTTLELLVCITYARRSRYVWTT